MVDKGLVVPGKVWTLRLVSLELKKQGEGILENFLVQHSIMDIFWFFSILKSIRNVAWHSRFEAENEACLADPNRISPSLIFLHPEVTIETKQNNVVLCAMLC